MSTFSGALIGGALTIVLLSNPVGWAAAIVLGAGAAAISWKVGVEMREAYTNSEEKIDFASISGIDKLCSK